MSAPQLRPYQGSAVAAVTRNLGEFRSTLLVMATGTGKTVTFSELVRQYRMRGAASLVLAHREELITQAQRKLAEFGIDADVEKGSQRASSMAKVVVASVQSLKGVRLERFARDRFGLVVVDEAHHATAKGYRAILDHFEGAKVLGVTATPLRADGQALGDVFETVAFRYEIRQAIREGFLVPITARHVVVDGVDLSAVKTRAGDLAQDQLAAVLETEQAIAGVVAPLLELTHARPTVVFGVDVAHAEALATALNDRRAGCARAIHGDTDDGERRRVLAAFEAGEFQFLCNCALLTEGWDSPRTECVAIARPTKSWALYVQMVGRGTRICPEVNKRNMLLLNFSGRAGKHRLVGPADALAGSDVGMSALEDDVRAELDRLLGTQAIDVAKVIVDATQAASERRDRMAAQAAVKFHVENIDPFIGPEPTANVDPRQLDMHPTWEHEPASQRQLEALESKGVTLSKLPAKFSRADAYRLLLRFSERKHTGMCSLNQARVLWRAGIRDTARISFHRARELVIKLAHAGYDKPYVLWGEPEASTTASQEAIAAIRAKSSRSRWAETESGVLQERSLSDAPASGIPESSDASLEGVS